MFKKKLDGIDKFFIFLFSLIPILLFTPLFRILYKFLRHGNVYGGFGVLSIDESWTEGAIISFIFFLILFLFIFEVKKKYLIIGIILAIFLFEGLIIRNLEYFSWYTFFSVIAFILAKIFLFVKSKYFQKK
jgi:hypothetical protein